MTTKQTSDIIKAQSELLIHLTERVVMLQTAFEAFVAHEFGTSGEKHDAHYALRKKLLAQDDQNSKVLIRTLKTALHQTGNGATSH